MAPYIDMEHYMNILYSQCEKHIPSNTGSRSRVKSMENSIPQIGEQKKIYENNYNVQQLKVFAKHHKLKIGGNKDQISLRLFCFLRLSFYITKIQRRFRGNLTRKHIAYQGPAFRKRLLCNNPTDFLTMEPIEEIIHYQFFSFMDDDGFVYGFDITSLYNLFLKSGVALKNPYNRKPIPEKVTQHLKYLIKLSKVLNLPLDIHIKNPHDELSREKSTELRVLELFQNIDSLGNYSNPVWFHSLNRNQVLRMIIELRDIWCYRAQLTNEVKRAICPPYGEPFSNMHYIQNEQNVEKIKQMVLAVFEKFVNSGIDQDSKTLGAYYVLGALTLVNENAATALPWLYQSLCIQ